MNSKTRKTLLAITIGCLALATSATAQGRGLTVEVTITNLTSGQVLSPPVVVSHRSNFRLFAAGDTASSELAMLAEDAVTGPLVTSLEQDSRVRRVEVGSGPIPPGASATVTIRTNGRHRRISVAGMLVTTNDAFYAVQGLRAAPALATRYAQAWDAGSEANNEDCDFIPGPPCGNPGVPTPSSEGFIHVHNGVHGLNDLLPQLFDWRNPVAKVSVRLVP